MSETRKPPRSSATRPEVRRPSAATNRDRDVRATVRPRRPDPRVTGPHPQATSADHAAARPPTEEGLRARIRELEAQLATEKEEREAEAGTMGEMLVRLASAESKARAAEGSVASAHDQSSEAEVRLRDVEASIAEAVSLLEELEQRERSLGELRARILRQAREALQGVGRTPRAT